MAVLPTVSFLLSVRDGMPYLPETIDSIIAQTFTDWQLVVNDNASKDGSADYIATRAFTEPRIRFIRSENDLGHSGGLNRAIEDCTGTWIARIDADDRALPDRLERQLAFVRADPEVVLTSCLAYYIDEHGRRVGKTYHDLTTREAFNTYMRTNEAIGVLHPGAFIDADTLRAVGGYRPAFDPANDIDLWSRVSERGLILVQPEYLMEYRIHGAASSQQHFIRARMKHEWSRACMIERRAGRPEPTWEAFEAEWHSQPVLRRLDRSRKITAKRLYREAGLDWIRGRRFKAATAFGAATMLQPRYTLSRLRGQMLGAASAVSRIRRRPTDAASIR